MAQIDFYFNQNEKKKLFQFILDLNFELIPENNYLTPNYIKLNKLSEIEKYLDGNVVFYLVHKEYTVSNLEMSSFVKDSVTFYYITAKQGGPSIDTYFNGIAEKKGVFSTNFVAHYPFYIINNERVEAPINLKKKFLEIVKYIKKQSINYKYTKRNVWIGKENDIELISSKLFQPF